MLADSHSLVTASCWIPALLLPLPRRFTPWLQSSPSASSFTWHMWRWLSFTRARSAPPIQRKTFSRSRDFRKRRTCWLPMSPPASAVQELRSTRRLAPRPKASRRTACCHRTALGVAGRHPGSHSYPAERARLTLRACRANRRAVDHRPRIRGEKKHPPTFQESHLWNHGARLQLFPAAV